MEITDVSRPPHSVAIVTGPKGGPGKQDVLFNNEKCFVVAPGVVTKIMEIFSAVAEYDREGNLYIGDVTLSSFRRQGIQQYSVASRLLATALVRVNVVETPTP